jgi:hypothetical protein
LDVYGKVEKNSQLRQSATEKDGSELIFGVILAIMGKLCPY